MMFGNPQHSYTRICSPPSPQGEPPSAESCRAHLAEAGNLRVWFPIKRGLLRRTVGHIKAVDDVSLAVREGAYPRHRRRERLGQDDAWPRAAAAGVVAGPHRVSR